MVSFNLLGYKDQSYQIAFLFIVVADGIKDQTGTKRVLKTTVAIFLSSAITEMAVTEWRPQVTDQTLEICAASQNL